MNLFVHVVDTEFGVPAANLHVTLRRCTAGSGWIDLGKGLTGPDGQLVVWRGTLPSSATFRIEFGIDQYYSTLGSVSLFPEAIVVFRAGDTDDDLNLHLLISPNLLLSYRGIANEQ